MNEELENNLRRAEAQIADLEERYEDLLEWLRDRYHGGDAEDGEALVEELFHHFKEDL